LRKIVVADTHAADFFAGLIFADGGKYGDDCETESHVEFFGMKLEFGNGRSVCNGAGSNDNC